MLEGKQARKLGAAQRLQPPVERVRPEADDDDVIGGDVSQGNWHAGCGRGSKQIVYHICQAVQLLDRYNRI